MYGIACYTCIRSSSAELLGFVVLQWRRRTAILSLLTLLTLLLLYCLLGTGHVKEFGAAAPAD
jgi:hypothetical protein